MLSKTRKTEPSKVAMIVRRFEAMVERGGGLGANANKACVEAAISSWMMR